MTFIEHYFENLLYDGEDIKGEPNKKHLSDEQIDAVKQCYYYVLYTMFNGNDDFKSFLKRDT